MLSPKTNKTLWSTVFYLSFIYINDTLHYFSDTQTYGNNVEINGTALQKDVSAEERLQNGLKTQRVDFSQDVDSSKRAREILVTQKPRDLNTVQKYNLIDSCCSFL